MDFAWHIAWFCRWLSVLELCRCANGTCMTTSVWYSTAYGALMGGLLVNSFSFQKKIKVQDKIDLKFHSGLISQRKFSGFIIDSLRSLIIIFTETIKGAKFNSSRPCLYYLRLYNEVAFSLRVLQQVPEPSDVILPPIHH